MWHPHTTIVGPRKLTVDVPLDRIPLYARAGSGLSTAITRSLSSR
jgi:alpha-glucosidase (family GH31 glycosyl hydrolase)